MINYDNYVNCINYNLTLDPDNWEFKSNINYTGTLEHVNEGEGNRYLYKIRSNYSSFYFSKKDFLMNLCYKNDAFGKTLKTDFQDFAYCSPTNLRYIYQTLLILDYIRSESLNNLNIIEIGGGYGGLAFYIKNIAPIFGVSVSSYTIFDLPAATQLQKKYLAAHGMDIQVGILDSIESVKLEKNSFLISNYAFSEIEMDLQKRYTEKVLNPYVSHGFLAWNMIQIYEFIQGKTISFRREVPLTGVYNYFVTFTPTN